MTNDQVRQMIELGSVSREERAARMEALTTTATDHLLYFRTRHDGGRTVCQTYGVVVEETADALTVASVTGLTVVVPLVDLIHRADRHLSHAEVTAILDAKGGGVNAYQTAGTVADLRVGDFIDTCGDGRKFKAQRVEASVVTLDRLGRKVRVGLRYGNFIFRADCPVVYRRETS